jgi:hypothetical protein
VKLKKGEKKGKVSENEMNTITINLTTNQGFHFEKKSKNRVGKNFNEFFFSIL